MKCVNEEIKENKKYDNEYILNKPYKILYFILLIAIATTIGLNFILTIPVPFGLSIANNIDWIGFWGSIIGSIIGGFITLLGLRITIKEQRRLEGEKSKLEVRPYLNIAIDYNMYNEIVNSESFDIKKYYKELIENYEDLKSIYGENITIDNYFEFKGIRISKEEEENSDENNEAALTDDEYTFIEGYRKSISNQIDPIESFIKRDNLKNILSNHWTNSIIKQRTKFDVLFGERDYDEITDDPFEISISDVDYIELCKLPRVVYIPIIIENLGLGPCVEVEYYFGNARHVVKKSILPGNKVKMLIHKNLIIRDYIEENGEPTKFKYKINVVIKYEDLLGNKNSVNHEVLIETKYFWQPNIFNIVEPTKAKNYSFIIESKNI